MLLTAPTTGPAGTRLPVQTVGVSHTLAEGAVGIDTDSQGVGVQ